MEAGLPRGGLQREGIPGLGADAGEGLPKRGPDWRERRGTSKGAELAGCLIPMKQMLDLVGHQAGLGDEIEQCDQDQGNAPGQGTPAGRNRG